jgi:hypothetical protein
MTIEGRPVVVVTPLDEGDWGRPSGHREAPRPARRAHLSKRR